MQYIFGLGNPGKEYQRTRHNIGFLFAEKLAVKLGLPSFRLQEKFHAEITQNQTWFVAKPQTFMNDSGLSVQSVLQFYQKAWLKEKTLNQVFIAHDDLDLPLGRFKIQLGTGPKVHNGLRSIYDHLHTENFWHIRLGVDSRNGDRTLPGHQYVLGGFPANEQPLVDQMILDAIAWLETHAQKA